MKDAPTVSEGIRDLLLRLLLLPEQASTAAADLDRLHFLIISVTMIGAAGIGLAAVYFMIKYRRRSHGQTTERIAISVPVELTLAGALLSFFLFCWAVGYRQYTDLHRLPRDAMEVYVTGKQWMWKFAHPGGRSTAGMLVVPRDEEVKLHITSRDVVHSFYVPAFRIKQDAVPGRYTTTWFEATKEGTFHIFCAEYCGQAHSQMWGRVVVLSPAQYQRWLEGETPDAVARVQGEADTVGGEAPEPEPASDLVSQGREAAVRYGCLSCHTLDGQPHVGPTWLGLYGKQVRLRDGTRVVADEDYLTESMMDPMAKLVEGYDPVMPSFAGVIEQDDVAPILELIKSLEDDDAQPAVRLPRVDAVPGTQGQVDGGLPAAGEEP
ncbi:MAG: cytochrome c oxidase subunit II [Myxococcota bacterium]